jgi:hypothetical protein
MACRKAADSVEKLLLLLEKTFGFTRITYLMAYCIYTAASAMIQDVKAGDLDAHAKMDTFLRALNGGRTTCPVIQRSLDIINKSLEPKAANNINSEGLGRNYLPAFPYHDARKDFTNEETFGNIDLDGFSLLDSFPEYHIDNISAAWYWPTQ